MSHNFLPFEVTELLPKENPYNSGHIYANTNEGIELIHFCNLCYGEFVNRDVWTIIDALTWLEEQGVYLEVSLNFSNKTKMQFCVAVINRTYKPEYHKLSEIISKLPLYNSRTEAYIAGITHCLNLIHNDNQRRNNY